MQSLGHVDNFQPLLELAESVVKGLVLAVVDVFLLEGAHEALDDAVLLLVGAATLGLPVFPPHYITKAQAAVESRINLGWFGRATALNR